MISRDHYVVLGISRDETPRGIRAAFRDLARQHHPDRAGPEGTPQFREVVDAYRTLSDPEQRSAYDARLRDRERSRVRAARPRGRERRHLDDVDVLGRSDSIRPSAEALLEHIFRGFGRVGLGKGERPEPLLCDVALDRDEALRGGVLPLRLPVRVPCAACHGTAHIGGYACAACDARGALRDQAVIPLEIPPGVRSGTLIEMPLDAWGVRNLWLRARIDVRPPFVR